jgi:hypothetical protein
MTAPIRRGGRKPLSELGKDAKYRINLAVRHAAVNIANGLAKAGPVWTGDFRDSYRIEAASSAARGGSDGKYPYVLANAPQLPITVKELNRVVKLRVINYSPHAAIAIDQDVAIDFKAESAPIEPDRVMRGYRPVPGLRGDTKNSPNAGMQRARSTAPVDWLETYMKGGQAQADLAKGIRVGFAE